MLPKNLFLVRHGQSEFNKIVHELRNGERDFSTLNPEILNRKGSKWRLTDLGREQAHITGEYIKNTLQRDKFRGYFVSDYIRAKETAAGLALPDAKWKVEPCLRERDWGDVGLKDFVDRSGASAFRDRELVLWRSPFWRIYGKLMLTHRPCIRYSTQGIFRR